MLRSRTRHEMRIPPFPGGTTLSIKEVFRRADGWTLRLDDGGGIWLGDDGTVEYREHKQGGWRSLDFARR